MPPTHALPPRYICDDAGERWRVHDCVFAQGKKRRVALGSLRANLRVFVSQHGVKRALHLERDRKLDDATLQHQLRGAGYLGTTPYIPVEDPR